MKGAKTSCEEQKYIVDSEPLFYFIFLLKDIEPFITTQDRWIKMGKLINMVLHKDFVHGLHIHIHGERQAVNKNILLDVESSSISRIDDISILFYFRFKTLN